MNRNRSLRNGDNLYPVLAYGEAMQTDLVPHRPAHLFERNLTIHRGLEGGNHLLSQPAMEVVGPGIHPEANHDEEQQDATRSRKPGAETKPSRYSCVAHVTSCRVRKTARY